MTIGQLKEIINKIDDDTEIFIRNSVNFCGNIAELEQVELTAFEFFGKSIPCAILNTAHTKEKLATKKDEYGDDVVCEFWINHKHTKK